MTKRFKKDKELARLRGEVEALRAQLRNESKYQGVNVSRKDEGTRAVKCPQTERAVLDIRPDLKKTAILTTICLGLLFVLYLTQSRW